MRWTRFTEKGKRKVEWKSKWNDEDDLNHLAIVRSLKSEFPKR